jgi:chromosome segregation ATPase
VFPWFFTPFPFLVLLCRRVDHGNARISALEAKLNASREAWEGATAAKAAAEKATRSAETKAKKAEKALADANQKRVQREQAVAKHRDKISALVGSKCRVVLFLFISHTYIC